MLLRKVMTFDLVTKNLEILNYFVPVAWGSFYWKALPGS